MLELKDVSLFVGAGDDIQPILSDVNARFPKKHFAALIGPSGCGKTTLLKTVAGIANGDEEGTVMWQGRDLSEDDFSPTEIGYVPQFSIAHEELTAGECVRCAVRLRQRGASGRRLDQVADETLSEVGLSEFRDRRVSVLSGGQRRRLALAMEIASAPSILLCDEVTSGLDAQAEDEIVALLHALSGRDRLVLSVTHSLRHLELYDSVLVLCGGVVAYHGSPFHLAHYFRIENLEDLYGRLAEREPADWARSWRKYRDVYTAEIQDARPDELEEMPEPELDEPAEGFADYPRDSAEVSATLSEDPVEIDLIYLADGKDGKDGKDGGSESKETDSAEGIEPVGIPGAVSQFFTLLARRFLIFSRSPGQLYLQLGLIFSFPVLVAIFAWNGLPQVQNLSVGLDLNIVRQIEESLEFLKQASTLGSLISGIVMFQVILLTLMGANNSGREIAAERLIFEKEKLSGLRPSSYIASKVAFLAVLVCAQSVWMGLFVHFVCGFPGELGAQLLFLLLVNAAMTSICLGISSWMGSAEQASMVSIYLVGFQLPLSGAVLALPDVIGYAVRPFISAYWSWSGVLQTLRGERYYDIVQMVVQTGLSPAMLCIWVLIAHIVIGIFVAWAGCLVSRMR